MVTVLVAKNEVFTFQRPWLIVFSPQLEAFTNEATIRRIEAAFLGIGEKSRSCPHCSTEGECWKNIPKDDITSDEAVSQIDDYEYFTPQRSLQT